MSGTMVTRSYVLAVTYFLRYECYVPLILQGLMRLYKPEQPGHFVIGARGVHTCCIACNFDDLFFWHRKRNLHCDWGFIVLFLLVLFCNDVGVDNTDGSVYDCKDTPWTMSLAGRRWVCLAPTSSWTTFKAEVSAWRHSRISVDDHLIYIFTVAYHARVAFYLVV